MAVALDTRSGELCGLVIHIRRSKVAIDIHTAIQRFKNSVQAPELWEGVAKHVLVYSWCMVRTNIDIDEKACAEVMRRYQFETKRDAVNFALRTVAAEPLSLQDAKRLRGSGWDGDLEEMRSN